MCIILSSRNGSLLPTPSCHHLFRKIIPSFTLPLKRFYFWKHSGNLWKIRNTVKVTRNRFPLLPGNQAFLSLLATRNRGEAKGDRVKPNIINMSNFWIKEMKVKYQLFQIPPYSTLYLSLSWRGEAFKFLILFIHASQSYALRESQV